MVCRQTGWLAAGVLPAAVHQSIMTPGNNWCDWLLDCGGLRCRSSVSVVWLAVAAQQPPARAAVTQPSHNISPYFSTKK